MNPSYKTMKDVLTDIKKIYLVGIGGVGMSGLALLLHDRGYSVSGCDQRQSSNTKLLEQEGIEVFIGHDARHIDADVDLLVYSSAIRSDNPEIKEAERRNIRIIKRGELLAQLSLTKQTIAVAGSHGKTTTTALMGYALAALGYKPTVFVGGLPLNYSRGAWWGDDYFVIETDESDGSFLHLRPQMSILTNVDHEHLDYYHTYENLEDSFRQFAANTTQMVFAWGDQPLLLDIVKDKKGVSFGWGEHNQISGRNFQYDGFFSCFDLFIRQTYLFPVKIPLLGQHNCLNTLAVFAVLDYLGQDLKKVNESLINFKGTKRRFQVQDRVASVVFVDDYAHHPTEIQAVIKAARLLKPKRLFVIMQPHRFSRLKSLQKEFCDCFHGADVVVITDVYSASEQAIADVHAQALFNEAKKHFSGTMEYIPTDRLVEELPAYFREGDLVLALGAGDINNILKQVINEFKKHRAL